ncbi:hypothetical protein DB347_24420 [Opitutaceae bacterium EW11]|nr:hypothetical protein DB347_24420 [Opitutaceae bacterium EW11]
MAEAPSGVLKVALIWAWGAAYALDRAMGNTQMTGWPFLLQVLFPASVGLLGGAFYFYAMGLVVDLTGAWFGGKASSSQIRVALIFGGVPKAASLLGYVLLVFVFDRAYFEDNSIPDGYGSTSVAFFYAVSCVVVGLSIWSVFTMANALAEVQQYVSAWRAFFHLVTAFVLLVLAIAVPFFLWFLLVSRP